MGTPDGLSTVTFLTSLLIVTTMFGCSNGPEEGDSDSTKFGTGYGFSWMASSYKIHLEEATVEDLAPHKVACPSQKKEKHQDKICIQICHVPPGNPANSHDKVLPLVAIKAHLDHGDYLGLCDAVTNEGSTVEDSEGVAEEDPVSGDGPTGDSLNGGDNGDTPIVPNFCVPYYEVDQDCDGFNDSTGMPYL